MNPWIRKDRVRWMQSLLAVPIKALTQLVRW